ncbi:MAG: hypothetical protein Tsb0020_28040 [Haliangiales bacterium]
MRTGALSEDALADALDQQRQTLPLASICYLLGYADEATLAKVLSRQHGVPAVVLDRSSVATELIDGVPRELMVRCEMVPVFEDERRIFVAAKEPHKVADALRELQFVRGKTLVPHVALHATLARTIRALNTARAGGHRFVHGPLATPSAAGSAGFMEVVSDVGDATAPVRGLPVTESVLEHVTRELVALDFSTDPATFPNASSLTELNLERPVFDGVGAAEADLTAEEAPPVGVAGAGGQGDEDEDDDTGVIPLDREPGAEAVTNLFELDSGATSQSSLSSITVMEELVAQPVSSRQALNLDGSPSVGAVAGVSSGPLKLLIVDDDFATRHLLVKALQPLGFMTLTSSSGGEAVRKIKAAPPDVVIIDAILPDMDGSEICRAIKQSRMYQNICVFLMSAMLDPALITDDVLRHYGADAYFAKPLDTRSITRRVLELVAARRAEVPARSTAADASEASDRRFRQALALYESGDIDAAIAVLRAGIEIDPLSAKHRFVLANLLQKKALIYEAIDEYEATVDLKPDYFPALTRLAYLYYKQGFATKAIEIWRRSLPHCEDEKLRENIELFMRRVIADMQLSGS